MKASFAILVAAVILTPAFSKAAAPAPDITVTQCVEQGGADPQPPGSAIRTCCLDSEITGIRGCYICDYKWENCEWEPAASKRPTGIVPNNGNLTINPGSEGTSKPPKSITMPPGVIAPSK
jgi:hypothetical protein